MALAHTDTTLCALRFSLRVDVFQILRAAIHHRCAHSPAFANATSGTGALPPPLVLNMLINAATLYLFVARCVPYGVVFYVEIC